MKVLDLGCQHGHSFEGWFGSEDDFQSQLARGLVQCPICDNAKITKKLSAPRLNISGATRPAASDSNTADSQTAAGGSAGESTMNSIAPQQDSMSASGSNDIGNARQNPASMSSALQPSDALQALMRNPDFQAAYMAMAKEVLAKTEDVGNDFAREARKIHYGESKERGIRGQASRDETLELLDEGIDVMPLPLPRALKGTLQ